MGWILGFTWIFGALDSGSDSGLWKFLTQASCLGMTCGPSVGSLSKRSGGSLGTFELTEIPTRVCQLVCVLVGAVVCGMCFLLGGLL